MEIYTEHWIIRATRESVKIVNQRTGMVMEVDPPVADELRRVVKVALRESGYLE